MRAERKLIECVIKLFPFATSINRLSTQNVEQLLDLINGKQSQNALDADDIANRYNKQIIYPPGKYGNFHSAFHPESGLR